MTGCDVPVTVVVFDSLGHQAEGAVGSAAPGARLPDQCHASRTRSGAAGVVAARAGGAPALAVVLDENASQPDPDVVDAQWRGLLRAVLP
jgi:hypothetical protein